MRLAAAVAILSTILGADRGGRQDKAERPLGVTVRAVAFSPDGKLLAAGTGGREEKGVLTVWELPENRVRFRRPHSTGIAGLAFSPDSATLAVAPYRANARLIDCRTGEIKRVLNRGNDEKPIAFAPIAFTPDGKLLAAASPDRGIRLWDVESGEEKQALAGHGGDIYSAVVSSDGRKLLSAAADAVRLWDLDGGRVVHTWKHGSSLNRCALFSADGRWVLTGGWDGTVRLWNAESGAPRARFQNMGGVDALALSSVPHRLAVCGGGRSIYLFELSLTDPDAAARGRIETLLRKLDDDRYEAREAAGQELLEVGFAAEPALRQAATESPSAEVRIRARRLRSTMLSQPRAVLAGHTKPVGALAFSPDGKLLASGGQDGFVRLWDVASFQEVARLEALQPEKP